MLPCLPQCRSEVEKRVNVTFRQYLVHDATSSTPTPNSGSTTGTDYFIDVRSNIIINMFIAIILFTLFAGDSKHGSGDGAFHWTS